jgi:hypothetical protein
LRPEVLSDGKPDPTGRLVCFVNGKSDGSSPPRRSWMNFLSQNGSSDKVAGNLFWIVERSWDFLAFMAEDLKIPFDTIMSVVEVNPDLSEKFGKPVRAICAARRAQMATSGTPFAGSVGATASPPTLTGPASPVGSGTG